MKLVFWLRTLSAVAAIAALCPQNLSSLNAAVIYWQGSGVSGNLTDPNYSDGTNTNLAPTASDVVNFGGGGTATHSVAGSINFEKLRVGHNQAPGGTGTGNVTINNGAMVNLTVGGAGAANASLWVGNVQNGTLNIDGAGTSVTSARLIIVGYGNNVNRTGTVNITNGGSLIAALGNISLGEGTGATPTGVQGHMFVDGILTTASVGADLNIGVHSATSTFTQTGGTVTIADIIEIGLSSSTNSSYTISGGTTTNGGNFFVGRGTTVGATANIQGSGVLNVGNRFLIGGGTATGATVNHSGGTVSTVLDVRVADAGTPDATYNLGGAGVLTTTTGGIVGRQGTGKFFQTGGQANFNGILAIGNREAAANAANGLYRISGGDLNIATALNVAVNGTGEFRVVGDDATIDVAGNVLVDNTANGLGALAFELESGDLLSMINVTGTATFNAGSSLVFDVSQAAPTQGVYDLLTAASIVDNGISFSGPPAWTYRIVAGGNGQILQAIVPEPTAWGLAVVAASLFARASRVRIK